MSDFDALLAQQLAADQEAEVQNENLSAKSEEELLTDARRLVGEKKFEDACETYSEVLDRRRLKNIDDFAIENAPIYFEYGTALFQNAQQSIDALGHTIAAAGQDLQEIGTLMQTQGAAATEDLQLSYEILEMARKGFEKDSSPASLGSLAATFMALGDVNLESDNFESARDDLGKALETELKSKTARLRFIAEAHYKIGLAFLCEKKMKEAKESFQNAASHIQKFLSSCATTTTTTTTSSTSTTTSASTTTSSTATTTASTTNKETSEIASVKAILEEINAKIADCDEVEADSKAASTAASNTTTASGATPATTTTSTTSTAAPTDAKHKQAVSAAVRSSSVFDAPSLPSTGVQNLGVLGTRKRKDAPQ